MTTLHSGLLALLAENEGNSRTLLSPGTSQRREVSDGNGNGNGNGNATATAGQDGQDGQD